MGDLDLKDVDLYDLLGILFTATTQEVKKAYRKKALTCHPDKNPDNPRAAELFHQLSKALEILTDDSARAAYDKVLRAKKAAKLRHRELDSKRQKLKEELEARERLAEESSKKYRSFDSRSAEEKLQAEIERLRKEGSKQVKEEQEYVRQQIIQDMLNAEKTCSSDNSAQNRLKVRWEAARDDPDNGGYNNDILNRLFSKYGDITVLIVSSKKKGSALVEFKTKEAAIMAQELERGLTANPLKVESLETDSHQKSSLNKKGATLADLSSKTKESETSNQSGVFPSMGSRVTSKPSSFPSFSFSPNISSGPAEPTDTDFESLVLQRMRQAQERKRLIEEMIKEDEQVTE